MRLLNYLAGIEEQGMTSGGIGGGATTSADIAVYPQRLPFTTRRNRKRFKEVRKSKLLGS